MIQQALFSDEETRKRIVNVASVLQRSPFRYPGGKTWLVPRIRQWLLSQPTPPKMLVEPFAGGGIVSLSAIFDNLVKHAMMVELDSEIAAVWQTILAGDAAWLADAIVQFDLTTESVNEVLTSKPASIQEKAFRTILKNRTYHGGILAPGAGLIKNGENGKGLRSRWYPETLRKRILAIATIRDRIEFIEGDGVEAIREVTDQPDVVLFIDPPYTAFGKKAGRRLYTHFDVDHEELFRVTARTASDFLMTYDDADGVRDLARQHNFDMELVSMKNTHHAKMTELLIGRCLDWVRS